MGHFNRGTKILIFFLFLPPQTLLCKHYKEVLMELNSQFILLFPPLSLSPLPVLQTNTKGKKCLCKLIMQESRGAFSFPHPLCFPLKHFRTSNTGFYFICSLFHNMIKVVPKRSIYFCFLEYMFLTSSCFTTVMCCFGNNMPIIRALVQ